MIIFETVIIVSTNGFIFTYTNVVGVPSSLFSVCKYVLYNITIRISSLKAFLFTPYVFFFLILFIPHLHLAKFVNSVCLRLTLMFVIGLSSYFVFAPPPPTSR